MNVVWAILSFLGALPDLIKLAMALERRRRGEIEIQGKLADDVKTIHEAFSAKDPAKLRALFDSE